MSRRHKLPCGPCCGPSECTIFAVATFVDLTGLTQIGTVTVDGGVAELETGEGLIVDETPTNYYDPVILTITAATEDDPATLLMVVAGIDEDNGLYGQVHRDGSTLTLEVGERVGGVNTPFVDPIEAEDTTGLGDSTTYSLCWVPGEVQTGGEFSLDGVFPTVAEVTVNPGDWDDPDLTLADDGVYATCDFGTSLVCGITWSGFPVALPPGSVIDEVGVGIFCRRKVLTGFGPINLTGLWIAKADGTLSANLGASQVVPAPLSPGAIGAIEDMATWGSDATWETFNNLGFYVAAEFTSSDGSSLEIDYCNISIDFTTPDRQPGRLTLSRGNVSVMTIDCSRAFNASAPGEGKSAAVISVLGQWDAEALNYSYHESPEKPSCPACECTNTTFPCEHCCEEPEALFQHVLDFAAGGWTNDGCDECDSVAGEFLLEPGPVIGGGNCVWTYVEDRGLCNGGAALFYIQLNLDDFSSTHCQWRAIVVLGRGSIIGGIAFFESDPFEKYESCQSLPVTLNKYHEVTSECGGNLPATITLEAP